MGVKILREGKGIKGKCSGCYFDIKKDGQSCWKHGNGYTPSISCGLSQIFTEITAAEFNASTGKKWRVKKDGRVVPYEAPRHITINGIKFPVYENDTKEDIENRVNEGMMDSPIIVKIESLGVDYVTK